MCYYSRLVPLEILRRNKIIHTGSSWSKDRVMRAAPNKIELFADRNRKKLCRVSIVRKHIRTIFKSMGCDSENISKGGSNATLYGVVIFLEADSYD